MDGSAFVRYAQIYASSQRTQGTYLQKERAISEVVEVLLGEAKKRDRRLAAPMPCPATHRVASTVF